MHPHNGCVTPYYYVHTHVWHDMTKPHGPRSKQGYVRTSTLSAELPTRPFEYRSGLSTEYGARNAITTFCSLMVCMIAEYTVPFIQVYRCGQSKSLVCMEYRYCAVAKKA